MIASVTRKSYFPLVPSHRCPFFENGTIPSVQFLRSWPSGKGWLMSLFSTLDGLVWRQLTNAPAFSAFPSPEKLSKTLKRPHVLLVRTRYQVPTKSARSFFCFVCLFTCFLHTFGLAHENRHKNRFSRTATKECGFFGVKPLTKPPPLSVGARTRNSNCPICDGMELPPAAGGDEVVSTHTIQEEHAQLILPGPMEPFFSFVFCHDMACFLDGRKIKPTGSTYRQKLKSVDRQKPVVIHD